MRKYSRDYGEGDKINIVGDGSRIEVVVKEIRGSRRMREVEFDIAVGGNRHSKTLDKMSGPLELIPGSGVMLGLDGRRCSGKRAQIFCRIPKEYAFGHIRAES